MSYPSQTTELLQAGIAAAKTGRQEEARRLLMQLIELDEHHEQGWLWLSGVVQTAEDKRICLENVLAINPSNSHARAGLEWLAHKEPEPSAEPDGCPRCSAAIPASSTACPHCGLPLIVACPNCGQYADVDQASCPSCGHVLGDFRQGARYHLALARAHLERRRRERAEEALAHAEAEAVGDPQVLAEVASAYTQLGRPDRAISAYEQAIEAAPNNALLYASLGSLYGQRGQENQARELFQKAGALAGNDPAVLCELARLQLEGGATSEALQQLEQVLKMQPKNAQAHLLLGDYYLSRDRPDRAYRLYEIAYQRAPADSALKQEAQRRLQRVQPAANQLADLDHAGVGRAARPVYRGRPGCVTVYAVLAGIGGLFGLFGAAAMLLVVSSGRDMIDEALEMAGPALTVDLDTILGALWIYVGVALFVAALNLTIAFGLWYMKNWARIAVIILNSLGLVANLVQAVGQLTVFREFASLTGSSGISLVILIPMLLGFAIQGFIVFWFAINRDLFS